MSYSRLRLPSPDTNISVSSPDSGALPMSQGALALSIIVLIGIIIIAIFLGLLYDKVDKLPSQLTGSS